MLVARGSGDRRQVCNDDEQTAPASSINRPEQSKRDRDSGLRIHAVRPRPFGFVTRVVDAQRQNDPETATDHEIDAARIAPP